MRLPPLVAVASVGASGANLTLPASAIAVAVFFAPAWIFSAPLPTSIVWTDDAEAGEM